MSISYFWKELSCDLCKSTFPEEIDHKGKKIQIIQYNVPQSIPYLVLEGTSKQHKNSKIIHVLNLGGSNEIKLGRGHESDIRISDISVS